MSTKVPAGSPEDIEAGVINKFNSVMDASGVDQQMRVAFSARQYVKHLLDRGTNEDASGVFRALVIAAERRDPHYQVGHHSSIDLALNHMLGGIADFTAGSIAEGVASLARLRVKTLQDRSSRSKKPIP